MAVDAVVVRVAAVLSKGEDADDDEAAYSDSPTGWRLPPSTWRRMCARGWALRRRTPTGYRISCRCSGFLRAPPSSSASRSRTSTSGAESRPSLPLRSILPPPPNDHSTARARR